MSWTENMRSLIAYNEWADKRVLHAAGELSAEELNRDVGLVFGNILGNLWHIVATQTGWRSILLGTQFERLPKPPEERPLETVAVWFEQSHEALRRYADGLSEEALSAEVRAVHPSGREYVWPAWQVVTHLLNHSSFHRGETGRALDALGHSPGDVDYIYFLDDAG